MHLIKKNRSHLRENQHTQSRDLQKLNLIVLDIPQIRCFRLIIAVKVLQ